MRRRVWRRGTVSAVGFGAMSFGGFYGPTTESDSLRTLARALDLGVDFWDTANVYGDGLCEQVIGKFLAARQKPARPGDARDQVRHSPTRRRRALLRQ